MTHPPNPISERMDNKIPLHTVPHASKSLAELRSQLMAASDIAESPLHAELNNEIARKALREEWGDYKTYIRTLSEEDLLSIAPLPFRRVLTTAESKGLWNQLRMTWDILKGCWFALKQGPARSNILAFHVEYR